MMSVWPRLSRTAAAKTLNAEARSPASTTTPELNGTVSRIATDTRTDQRTGQSYYLVRISMTAGEIKRLGDVKLTPGMPVEAFIETGERTMLSYFVKPLRDQLIRAFREK